VCAVALDKAAIDVLERRQPFRHDRHPPQQSEEWRRLLGLAQHSQVHVKSSAFFRVSKEQYPYADAAAALRVLVDAFGARRVMWGTDWPWVSEQCG